MSDTLSAVAEILYEVDAMGTACYENENIDEYIDVAKLIVEEKMSVEEAFEFAFWEDCIPLFSLNKIKRMINQLNSD